MSISGLFDPFDYRLSNRNTPCSPNRLVLPGAAPIGFGFAFPIERQTLFDVQVHVLAKLHEIQDRAQVDIARAIPGNRPESRVRGWSLVMVGTSPLSLNADTSSLAGFPFADASVDPSAASLVSVIITKTLSQ